MTNTTICRHTVAELRKILKGRIALAEVSGSHGHQDVRISHADAINATEGFSGVWVVDETNESGRPVWKEIRLSFYDDTHFSGTDHCPHI